MPVDQFKSFVNTFGQSFPAPSWFVLYFTVENFVKVVTVHLLFFCPSFLASYLQLSPETNDDLAFCRGLCNVVILLKFTLLNIVHLLHRIVHRFAFGISINFGKMFLNLNFLSCSSAGTDGHQLQIFSSFFSSRFLSFKVHLLWHAVRELSFVLTSLQCASLTFFRFLDM